MFDWLSRMLRPSKADEHQQFFEMIDEFNEVAGGGEPVTTRKFLGHLALRSSTLALGDPQYMPGGLEVPNIVANKVAIWASLWSYPSGVATVKALMLLLGEPADAGTRRKIGEIGIDSAKLVVADKADLEEHWTQTGPDRIGVILTGRDDTVLRLLRKRFRLKTVQVNRIRAEVVGPVSQQLEAEIEAFLKADPRYADFPFFHFRVQTNNSFERANYLKKTWEFMPVGNQPVPLMFVCETGRGDGCYDVYGEFAGEIPHSLSVTFIED